MRAIVVLFDSLNRKFLPNYGCGWTHAPNFERLGRRTVTFENAYGGSMPCMPARRELHTGRYNFLHRSWGPLEPFDDSVPQLLGENGVYTHLATDHQHYFEDGGATYHGRFSSFEFFRGQQGDRWKGQVAEPEVPESLRINRYASWRHDWVNRAHLAREEDHPQTLLFDAGIEFLETNAGEDRWLLQLECFDPHEPFFSYEDQKRHYPHDYAGPQFDWPDYKRTDEPDDAVEHARLEYAALLTKCDASLGRVLDFMDEHAMWEDTMLVVCTDHGFLLGEHGWWGKNVQPWYDENIHTPLFVWDPREAVGGVRTDALVQTVDLGPTLLDLFGVEPTPRMRGRSLRPALAACAGTASTETAASTEVAPVREGALFGAFGAHVNVTDGRYVYMRACATADNAPLYEHTLMPTHMNTRFTPQEIAGAELLPGLPFSQGAPVLRLLGRAWGNPSDFGTLLFDLREDPGQEHPLDDDDLELRMIGLMLRLLRENEAPPSQYERLGLPAEGPAGPEHLLVRKQWDRMTEARLPLPVAADLAGDGGAKVPIAELLEDPRAAAVLEDALGAGAVARLRGLGGMTLVATAALVPSLTGARVRELHERLTEAQERETEPA